MSNIEVLFVPLYINKLMDFLLPSNYIFVNKLKLLNYKWVMLRHHLYLYTYIKWHPFNTSFLYWFNCSKNTNTH